MGAQESKPASQAELLAGYSGPEQRMLLRNCSLLAGRDPSDPSSFSEADWCGVHAAMAGALAAGVFRGFARGAKVLDCDRVIRTLAALRDDKPARLLFLVDASGAASPPGDGPDGGAALCRFVQLVGGDGAAWLQSVAPSRWSTAAEPWLAQLGPSPPAPPACSGRADLAAWAARSDQAAAAAEALSQLSHAAWLVDHRELQPVPDLGGDASALLPPHALRPLAAALPPNQRAAWRLLFSSSRDGASFTRLCALAFGRAPCLLVIRDRDGAVFGGYSPEPFHTSPKFFGDFSSFLFALTGGGGGGGGGGGVGAGVRVHRASGDNSNFVYCNAHKEMLPNGIAFGGNLDSRFFGLWLHESLETGRAEEQCSTYSLGTSVASAAEFRVAAIEVWAVREDVSPPAADSSGGGALSDAHKETRAFLAMAGREMRSEAVAPPPQPEEEEA